MEFLSGTALSKYLLERYAKNPRGWNFTVAPSSKETFFDALVTGPEESWQLKIDSIFKAAPLVLGAKVDQPSKKLPPHALPSYGYRKLDPAIVMKLLREASEENERPSSSTLDRILGSLEPTAPVEGSSYAEGPFVFTNQKILGISEAQRKLDERLTFGIKNLMRERYPGYG
jgi:hypothetical protein